MKKILTLALALMTGLSFAQPYNNTYDVNGNFNQLRPSFNIVKNNQESYTVSDGTNGQSNHFILTRLAVGGAPICNLIFRAFNDPIGGYLYVEALHETVNGDVIVGGYYYADRNNIILQPFLARIRPNSLGLPCGAQQGTLIWHRVYPVNQRNIVNAAINKVSLCRVYDEPGENYLFVVAGDSDINPGVEVATNVLKVNGANGVLMFSNKYYPTIPGQFPNLREYPGDVEYSTQKRMYMIAGHREQTNDDGVVNYQMYHFGIFSNGAMFLPAPANFLTQTSNSIPVDQDMVYEAATDQFATAFTHDMNNYVAGVQSLIGFVKVTPALFPSDFGLIWHNQGDIHNGRSISHRVQGGFAIAAGTRDNQTFINNPALQFVDNLGVPTSAFMRYNILDNVFFAHHAWNPALDHFVLASEQNTDLRVISTDAIGDDRCGLRNYDRKYQPYSPSIKLYEYRPRTFNKDQPQSISWMNLPPPIRMCSGVPPVDSYRTGSFTGLSSFTADKLDIKVYPSVVSRNNAELTIENGSGAEMRVEVRNITGQLIQATEHVGSGKTTLTLNQDLSAGVYMVHFYNENGSISATEKILISE